MGVLTLIVFTIILSPLVSSFIRPIDVYQNVVKGLSEYSDYDSIIFLHATSTTVLLQDIAKLTLLKNLQFYFNELSTEVTVTDVNTFASQMFKDSSEIKRTLIVLLHDSYEIKKQLKETVFPSIDVSKPTWLMFMSDNVDIDDFFSNIYVPFNCEFIVSKKDISEGNSEIMKEIYRLDKGLKLEQRDFATWNLNDGIQLPHLSFYQRRSNLQGHMLRVALLLDPPATDIIITKDGKIKLGGYMADIMSHLQEKMNFTVSYQVIDGLKSFFNNGHLKYSQIEAQNFYDIFLSLSAITESRAKIADFTIPLSLSESNFYFKKPTNTFEWNKYLLPFHTDTWLVILLTMLVFGILVTAFQKLHYTRYEKTFIENHESTKLMDNSFEAFGTLCGQAGSRSIIDSIGLLQFTLHLTAVIILAAYSAILTSLLAVSTPDLSLRTIEGLFQTGSFKVGFSEDSAYQDFFERSSDPIMTMLYEKSFQDRLPFTTSSGLTKACNENKYAFIAPYTLVNSLDFTECPLIASEPMFLTSFAFGLKQNSPYREIFNEYIGPMISSGVIKRILNTQGSIVSKPMDDVWKPVEFIDIAPLIALIIILGIVGIFLVLVENIIHFFTKNRKNTTISDWRISNIEYPTDEFGVVNTY